MTRALSKIDAVHRRIMIILLRDVTHVLSLIHDSTLCVVSVIIRVLPDPCHLKFVSLQQQQQHNPDRIASGSLFLSPSVVAIYACATRRLSCKVLPVVRLYR